MTTRIKLSAVSLGAGILLGSIVILTTRAEAATVFYYDRATWEADLAARGLTLANYPFTAANLANSNELGSPPSPNTQLGPTLTFPSLATGLPFGFQLAAMEPGSGLYFEPSAGPYGPNTLAIDDDGTGNTRYNDDWQVTVTEAPLWAFGADVIDNGANIGESFEVFGPGDTLLGPAPTPLTPPGMPFPDSRFIGVISNDPIQRIFFDADSSYFDNIGIKDFAFAVPEPGTLSLLALGGLVLFRRKR